MTDDEFLRAFEDCRIPGDLWTHEAHVRMAWLYLRDRPLDEVVPIVCEGIRRYGASRGRAHAYHETITVASLVLIDRRIDRGEGRGTFDEFRDAHPDLLDRTLSALLRYYSREVLFSDEARGAFVGPDLAPLPSGRGGVDDRGEVDFEGAVG